MTSHKNVSWTARVKSKKSGNRPQNNGKWSKAVYTIYSISIPSDIANELGLKPDVEMHLALHASITKPPKKKVK
jgi:hypothetical protein